MVCARPFLLSPDPRMSDFTLFHISSPVFHDHWFLLHASFHTSSFACLSSSLYSLCYLTGVFLLSISSVTLISLFFATDLIKCCVITRIFSSCYPPLAHYSTDSPLVIIILPIPFIAPHLPERYIQKRAAWHSPVGCSYFLLCGGESGLHLAAHAGVACFLDVGQTVVFGPQKANCFSSERRQHLACACFWEQANVFLPHADRMVANCYFYHGHWQLSS